MTEETGMERSVDERDFALLQADPCTFEVLARILRGKCEWVLTDHKQLILCHSAALYPVWVWTPDGAAKEILERAWSLLMKHRPLDQGFRWNMKYELAEYCIARAKAQGIPAGVAINLLAYDCPSPREPDRTADGSLFVCTEPDMREVAGMLRRFFDGVDDKAPEEAVLMENAAAYIARRGFFLWKNEAGETVACCSVKKNGMLASISSVYTLPAFRRRHYAESLVYRVTSALREQGFLPVLYTDADYIASNACYEKIGYVRRGRLCTVACLT